MDHFLDAMKSFEANMKSQLGAAYFAPDMKRRYKKMEKDAFLFLRATCWRWAQGARTICPELFDAPVVPSVGDAHCGNFALWRDAEARLVWGVSDYDEAARLPFPLDLVRLCTSVALALRDAGVVEISRAALTGYRHGLANPRPFVLERDHLWLRDRFVSSDEQREDFWQELRAARKARLPVDFEAALRHSLPDRDLNVRFARRSAGAGSLGRARFVALGEFRGGPIAVEVKAALPSCWPIGREKGLSAGMATGRWRSPDPMLRYTAKHVTRRLAPNSRKISFDKVRPRLRDDLVAAMAADLAAIHVAEWEDGEALVAGLEALPRRWLTSAIARMGEWTEQEYRAYRNASSGHKRSK